MPKVLPGVAIAVAPNGARRSKTDHPALPTSPAEIARVARECLDAGAAMIHLHVRDNDGRHLLDTIAYRRAIEAVTELSGQKLLIQVTTESVGLYRPEEQIALIHELRPEAASLALREIAPRPEDEPAFAALLGFMRHEHILPQIILYSMQDAQRLSLLEARGMIPFERLPVLYVLGRYSPGMNSSPSDLSAYLEHARARPWMVCAFGSAESRCAVAGALLGGDVRVGFENNLCRPDGVKAKSNAELVDAVVSPLRSLGLTLADADALRVSWAI